ncbi:MAG TPA: CRTAC1 family protein [Gaiellaceae bacterium]|nr:CRTAC1 family protein [Gaiellaceae bacterium]
MRPARLLRLAGALAVAGVVLAACVSELAGETVDRSSASPRGGLQFVDVADEVGLDFRHGAFRWDVTPDPPAMMGGGVCWLDYDDDGWLDLFVVNSFAEAEAGRWRETGGLPEAALYRNTDGEFVDVSSESGANLAVRGNGCVAADFDLDGLTDLYVTTSRVNALLWNEGDGTFTEGAVAAGAAAYGWRTGAAAGDVNGDGWLDLFVAGYADLSNRSPGASKGFPNTYLGVRDLLLLSNGPAAGRVTFREVGVEAGLEAARFEYGLGALFSDLDRDGDLDLHVANDTNPNRLYENVAWPGGAEADPAGLGFRFEERAAGAGIADPNAGMGIAGGDYDADGRTDLFVTNARGQLHAAFRSLPPDEHEPSFEDSRDDFEPALGDALTGWGVSWADFDLDTDLDLVVVNGAVPVTDLSEDAQLVQLFGNEERGRFKELTRAAGLHAVGPILGRGSATADYDNDGDLDVAVGSIGGALALLENTGEGGNWLEVELEGFHPGAVVAAVLPDGRELVREVQAGSSYLSSEDPRSHFGLGEAGEVSELVVRWPGGGESRLTGVDANQLVRVQAPE